MNHSQQESLRQMIILHNSYPVGKDKDNLRNSIYKEILPFMKIWITAILSKKGIFWNKDEILSQSWDCFQFCLERFRPEKKEIALPNHFYSYTKFYLKTYKLKMNGNMPAQEFENKTSCAGDEKLYDLLDELKSFRDMLDKEYVLVFDDALASLMPSNKNRKYRIKESNLLPIRYQESKKIFKIVIDYLLKR